MDITGESSAESRLNIASLGEIRLSTGSPVWTTITVNSSSYVNTLEFGYEFSNGNAGLLTVFHNGALVETIDQRLMENTGTSHTIPISIHSTKNGTLSFRLDSMNEDLSEVLLTSIEVSRINTLNYLDPDGDNISREFDQDNDNDGIIDDIDMFPFDPSEHVDSDSDGIGDFEDPDNDNDLIIDGLDNCPNSANFSQLDSDFDGVGDTCGNSDSDGDGIFDNDDALPNHPGESLDSDADGIGDNAEGKARKWHDVLGSAMFEWSSLP